ncbi:ABC transporter ATP-binding protein [Melissococcus plutonius]|uniref:ABC transporter, ATP-binding protein n=2 Tax=Melissococcus plutonius TaxID=33970 RepID=F3YCX8_MELPT|nr:ABC transporter ATP-binding protein [Melissococcus plutonius]BAL62951.1 ABC transporter ATP-binding protein [Melissococcus plutonius DAT561]AIM26024.1 bacitracin export ATP-binding protein BceA [Melissococcus plutonius S1]KMT23398.1 bacitracin export ATP-binding protein BceA [Melissococcus plutonius]KMT23548.1 bacitracin export ATP-binding protein BceA [Melissococcus plutonius]KMT28062.1 bacitracin export ATP-binding protein BceA [Melissococcus plutonius]
MTNIVEVTNLKKTYGKNNETKTQALKGISFSVEKGEFIGIMGASGSGKSTLLNILSTLDKPTTGEVKINQADVTKLKGDTLADFRAKEVGFIFQDFNLLENMTSAENIAVPLSLQGIKPKIIKQRIQQIAQHLSINAVLDKYPTEISGGQKQRVASARALITQPTILLGDEPTGALDSKSAKDLLDMMNKLNTQDKISILMVTHDSFSASYCQRILFIKDGIIHKEIFRGEQSRQKFQQMILSILGTLEQ